MAKSISLLEGKKQALSILSTYGDKAEEYVSELSKLDPTKTKKYLEALAKSLHTWLEQGNSLPDFFIQAQDIPELIKKVENKKYVVENLNNIQDIYILETALNKGAIKLTRSSKRRGIEGLTKDTDYTLLYENEFVLVVMPHNWESSKILADSHVGFSEGQWCIAYQRTEEYWNKYIIKQQLVPIYFIVVDSSILDELEKDNKNYPLNSKFAWLVGDDDQLWNQEDRHIGSRPSKELLGMLSISTEEINKIQQEALELGPDRIEGWGTRRELIESSMIRGEFHLNVNSGSFDGYVEFYFERGYDYEDMETEDFERKEVGGEVQLGKEFLKSEEGKNFLLDIKASADLEGVSIENYLKDIEYPPLWDNTLFIKYDGSETFAEIIDYFYSTYSPDDSDIYVNSNQLTDYLKNKGIDTLVYIVPDNSFPDVIQDPFTVQIDRMFPHTKRNFIDEIVFTSGKQELTAVIYTRSSDQAGLEGEYQNIPYLNSLLKDGWVSDEESEKKAGQQFFQFESLKKELRALSKRYRG